MYTLIRNLVLIIAIMLLQACVSVSNNTAANIIGSWQSNLQGFQVITTYTDTTVSVDGREPVAYSLDANTLTIAGDETVARLVSFPSADEMIQTDPMTNTELRFIRTNQ